MKKLAFVLLLIPVLNFSQKKITLEDIWVNGKFSARHAAGFNVLNDGVNYVDIVNSNGQLILSQFDLKTGNKVKDLVSAADIKFNGKQLNLATYQFSPNEDKLLLYENLENVYRRSPKANYYVYDIASKKTIQLTDKGQQMFPVFSPDGKKIAYVRENNLYIKHLDTGIEIIVTRDGEQNRIKNGWADWVYEEEFSRADYFDWSSNSQYLAYVKFDETRVRDFTMDYYNGELYPTKYTFKYPKAGEDNSIVSVHIFDETSKKTTMADIGTEKDIYIPRIQFTNNPMILSITRLNRLQNKLELIFTDVIGGKGVVAYTDESKTYVDVTDDLRFVGDKGFIISSERDEYNHLYYYDISGKLINQITKGPFDVTEFNGFDEDTKTLYYTSTENGAVNRDVYSVKLNGKDKKRLSAKSGFTSYEFTPGYKYYISSYSNANTPPVYELNSINGKTIKVLEDNTALKNVMMDYNLSTKQFFTFKTTEGVELNGWTLKPQNFDSTKKYPVYMYAYGGPGSNEVNNAWDGVDYFWHNLLNQEGYMVVLITGVLKGVAVNSNTVPICNWEN